MLRKKGGYHLECDKLLHKGVGGGVRMAAFSATYFLNGPIRFCFFHFQMHERHFRSSISLCYWLLFPTMRLMEIARECTTPNFPTQKTLQTKNNLPTKEAKKPRKILLH